ncbi:MAG: thiol oxidoreductase [Pseudomonadales bacterium]|nr:thiol oxidoreductase [Pseudomonadales bacterium]
MIRNTFFLFSLILTLLLHACSNSDDSIPALSADERLPGGLTSVDSIRSDFMQPLQNLSKQRQREFYVGLSFFRDPWVIAPSITSDRDGLGPLFNARACFTCHPRAGRGRPPSSVDEPMLSMFLRLSIPGKNKQLGVMPEPTYGTQLQVRGTSMENNFGLARQNGIAEGDGVIGEVHSYIEYTTINGKYADGSTWSLRKPTYKVRDLAWGDMHPDTLFSPRMAQQLIGLGLLEAIDEQDILSYADPADKNSDGISGRVNRVWNRQTNTTVIGRFGLKANQPDLTHQTASAFRGDIGITSDLAPEQPCTDLQPACLQAKDGVDPNYGVEIKPDLINAVSYFLRTLAVPIRQNWNNKQVLAGRALFYQANCNTCHRPSYKTASKTIEPELANQTIWPYSDLLLHDMGEGLADGRPDFEASGIEWRTSPLWGLGKSEKVSGKPFYLHDGRARTLSEAILWHGGEATSARDKFMAMNKKDRTALLEFIHSL